MPPAPGPAGEKRISAMFVEQRMYTLKPGASGAFVEFYEKNGRAVQTGILGNPVGYYTAEIGPLNVMTMNWAYWSLDERMERRDRLSADADWRRYLAHARELVVAQESRILRPVPFFEPQLQQIIKQGRDL